MLLYYTPITAPILLRLKMLVVRKNIWFLLFCALLLSGCGTIDMRKISIDPKIPTLSAKKSSRNAGLVLNESIVNYNYSFNSGLQIFLMANVKGEIEVGKNLSQAIYGIVSNKFGNVAVVRDIKELSGVDMYLVPRITSFEYSPPFTGMSSHTAEVELVTDVFSRDGQRRDSFVVKQEGSRSMLNQIVMESNYDMAQYAVNEAIENLLKEFARKLDERY